ncbi:hypothetical protein RHMOL_Rhmol04G0224000 [Rhododendron molle]|uniref:Uncharacterized protein n=1 Tax=Rhododendron molle TaxID=49168 RepID=A0ACC0P4H1_RHOML|nr:hypothetical protein RHMOL_Rhmol04G0224000 [Rhododendron molle]
MARLPSLLGFREGVIACEPERIDWLMINGEKGRTILWGNRKSKRFLPRESLIPTTQPPFQSTKPQESPPFLLKQGHNMWRPFSYRGALPDPALWPEWNSKDSLTKSLSYNSEFAKTHGTLSTIFRCTGHRSNGASSSFRELWRISSGLRFCLAEAAPLWTSSADTSASFVHVCFRNRVVNHIF